MCIRESKDTAMAGAEGGRGVEGGWKERRRSRRGESSRDEVMSGYYKMS